MIRRPPRSTLSSSSAASDVYKRQNEYAVMSILLDDSMACTHFSLEASSNSATTALLMMVVILSFILSWLVWVMTVSYTHLRAHETPEHLVCRLLLEKKKIKKRDNLPLYINYLL
eukprot:TRINITY_DN16898_c0_g1_i1.p1 TRINITY_DN16898_c0_g1~~TRINITY_DN16898_c0_g1_i1.p1  ORF type:complete len:115 (+),score=30.76 TRINITY_DN16898_c0_g1_i1:66-410(+)